jgi:hypothetical protein
MEKMKLVVAVHSVVPKTVWGGNFVPYFPPYKTHFVLKNFPKKSCFLIALEVGYKIFRNALLIMERVLSPVAICQTGNALLFCGPENP